MNNYQNSNSHSFENFYKTSCSGVKTGFIGNLALSKICDFANHRQLYKGL